MNRTWIFGHVGGSFSVFIATRTHITTVCILFTSVTRGDTRTSPYTRAKTTPRGLGDDV